MASIPYYAANPDDGTQTYTWVHVEHAPDSGGVPGAWSEFASVAIDTMHEYTKVTDPGGSSTEWYHHRYETTNGSAVFSDFSDAIQTGDSIVRQRIALDIAADDITPADWDRWIAESLGEMFPYGIWYPLRVTITPTTNATTHVVDEYYPLDQRIRDAFAVELVDQTTSKHIDWLTEGPEWKQYAGELRLLDADDSYNYVVHGKAQFRSVGELTDDFFPLLSSWLAWKYVQFRRKQREDFIAYIVGDPRTDTTWADLRAAEQREQQYAMSLVSGLALAEPAIEWSWGRT